MNEESKGAFGRIQEEMDESFHPLYRKLREHLREIGIVLGAIILVAASITGYQYYQEYSIQTTKQEFEKIITSTQGENKIQRLDKLLSTAPSSLRQAILMELSKISMKQEKYSQAADYWKQLAKSTSKSNLEVIAKLGEAKALNLQDKNNRAMQILQQLSLNAPKTFQQSIKFELARVAEEEQKWQKALSAYQEMASGSKFGGDRQQYIQYKISEIKQKLSSKKS